ncbi:hypothetical protein C8Q76DRAFT_801927 [Earliella scabrosa]|nr:hypothetical protein C8Q76DRAFT_801927 [Earliella scabrosa]
MNPQHVLPPPQTPPRRPARRGEQAVGAHFTTPQGRRAPRKDSAIVVRPDAVLLQQHLSQELDALLQPDDPPPSIPSTPAATTLGSDTLVGDSDTEMGDADGVNADPLFPPEHMELAPEIGEGHDATTQKQVRRLHPDDATNRLYGAWLILIPELVPHYLTYLESAQQRVGRVSGEILHHCSHDATCMTEVTSITCLHFDYLIELEVHSCACASLPHTLVRNGLFPTSPTHPRVAVSIDLLDFYFALFERSADAITALAGALKTLYQRRGFPILNEKGEPVRDPFRRGLGHAVQWYDCLRGRVDNLVESAMDESIEAINCRKGMLRLIITKRTQAVPSSTHPFLRQVCRDVPLNTSVKNQKHARKEVQQDVLGNLRTDVRPKVLGNVPWEVREDIPPNNRRKVRWEAREDIPLNNRRKVQWEVREDIPPDNRRKVRWEVQRDALPQNLADIPLRPACDRILQKRCPACFGGTRFGRNFIDRGGDVHVAIDATFSQRHNLAAGDSPWFHEPKYFISKDAVDAVGARIESARKSTPRQHKSVVPDAALDECEKSFEAADEQKAKTQGSKFDDTGLMALVCRHDIVLFLANVDTPGEQQKYGVALVEHLVSLLPPAATVAVFYDIGCVLDRSLHLYDILPQAVVERLIFATSVMHAYGHQWSCQLVYNPRLREGLGLTEGEGTERVWSKFRKLIGVTRTSGRSRRIWYLDRHADSVNAVAREELGSWHRTRLKTGVEMRGVKADRELAEIGIPVPELREQWTLQREAQLSVRNHAPARLKKELDSVLGLQADLDEIKKYISTVQANVAKEDNNPQAHDFLKSLGASHARTIEQVEGLYASLNVPEDFPELRGLPLSFFNQYCDNMKRLYRKKWNIPLPTSLPTELTALREDPSLLTDVWITPMPLPMPRWLHEPNVRRGIRAMLLKDRCLEERRRLGDEADNLCRWYGQELAAVELALRTPRFFRIHFLLQQKRTELLLLQARWRTPLASEVRFVAHTNEAIRIAESVSGTSQTQALSWVHFTFQDEPSDGDGRHDPEEGHADSETIIAQDTIIQLIGGDEDDDDSEDDGDSDDKGGSTQYTSSYRSVRGAGDLEQAPIYPPTSPSPLPSNPGHALPPLTPNPSRGRSTPQDRDRLDCSLPHPREGTAAEMFQKELMLAKIPNPYKGPVDTVLSLPKSSSRPPTGPLKPRLLPHPNPSLRALVFSPDDMDRLRFPEKWLNDDCLNGCAQLLVHHFGTEKVAGGSVAFLHSFAMAQHRNGTSTDQSLWNTSRLSSYWEKDVWVIPVHKIDAHHWELAIVYLADSRIAYFDSFGHKTSWEDDAKVVLTLMYRLRRLAGEQGFAMRSLEDRDWVAYSIASRRLQSNGYDCGVWVLACIAALLRGYETIDISEKDVGKFRARLLGLLVERTSEVHSSEGRE